MADRSVVVRLRAEISDYKRKLKEAEAETAGFKKSVDGAGDGVDDLGKKSGKASAEVDRLSGRLAIARDILLTIGPAAVPITAAAIPALTGLAAALGATVIGVGVGVAAFQGLGDALEAVRTAELEPTAENLQAAREQLEALDPAAAAFVGQLNELVPQLKEIRDSAAGGLFPGLGEGIDAVEKRLPLFDRLAGKVGEVLGDNAADAGASLASGRWGPFLRFLEDEAPGALDSVIGLTGDLAHGLSELWMAFDPLNDSVISGLEDGADAFDRWASGLDQTEGFQAFLDYLETTGPQVLDTVGSIGDAVVQLLQALAPLGGPSLALIRGFADAVALLAGSDFGGPILAGAAAFAAYSRAAAIAIGLAKTFRSTATASALAGSAPTGDAPDGKGKASATARGGEAAALVAGGVLLVDTLQSKYDGLNVTLGETSEALAGLAAGQTEKLSGDFSGLADSFDRLTDPNRAQALQTGIADFIGGGDDDDVYKARDQFEAIDDALTSITQNQGAEAGRANFEALAQSMGLAGDQVDALRGLLPGYSGALDSADAAAKAAADGTSEFGAAADDAAGSTRTFSQALGELNGWLDRRAALRGYRESVADLGEALKDGFQPKDAETIDQVGTAISQVAAGIKDKGVRAEFLSGARASLVDIAEQSGPKARAEIEKLIGAMDDATVTRPPIPVTAETRDALQRITGVGAVLDAIGGKRPRPTIDANDAPARSKTAGTKRALDILDLLSVRPTIAVDNGAALQGIGGVRLALAGLRDKTVYINTINRRSGPGGQGPAVANAWGGVYDHVAVGDVRDGHQPEVTRPGGVTRVWAEPETMGEAYIPLANDGRRHRAKGLLEDVADRFGGEVEWYARGGGQQLRSKIRAQKKASRALDDFDVDLTVDADGLSDALGGVVEDFDRIRDLFKDGGLRYREGRRDQERAVRESARQFDSLTETLKKSRDAQAAYSSEVTGSFDNDVFGNGLAGFDTGVAANTNDSRSFEEALRAAVGLGLDGALLQAAGSSKDLTFLQQLVATGAGGIDARERSYDAMGAAQSSLGQFGGQAVFGAEVARNSADVAREVSELRKDIRAMKKEVRDGAREGTRDGAREGSQQGTREGAAGAAQAKQTRTTQAKQTTSRGGRGNNGRGRGGRG